MCDEKESPFQTLEKNKIKKKNADNILIKYTSTKLYQ